MALKIVRNDIIKMNTEAIVNTANDHVSVGTGCDSAVYKAAGYDELLKYREDNIGFVAEGVFESLEPVGFKTGAPSSVQNREMEDGGMRECCKILNVLKYEIVE